MACATINIRGLICKKFVESYGIFFSLTFSFHFTTFIWQLRVWLGSPSFLFSFFHSPSHSLLVRPTPNRHIESNLEKIIIKKTYHLFAAKYLFYQKLTISWDYERYSIDNVEKYFLNILVGKQYKLIWPFSNHCALSGFAYWFLVDCLSLPNT